MTTGDYGASDFINSSVGLLMPVLTLCIANGSLRFAMNHHEDHKQVFSFGIKVIIAGFGILLVAYPIFLQIGVINDYLFLFYLTYITSAIYNYLNQFARGINKIKLIGICGVLSTIIVVTSNIVLLMVFRLGLTGYLISFILSHVIGSIVLFIGGGMHKYTSLKHSEKRLKIDMLKYCIPLVPNSLSWWLNNAANRYVIIAFCGVSQLGLFSVAARIPTILTTLQGVFYQAWLLSAISEYESEDKSEFYTKVYKFYNLLMLLSCSALIGLVKVISGIMLSGEFYTAWKYIPLLLVSVVFGALAGFLGSLYSASKQTKMLFITTFAGGIVSLIFNFLLVPYWGPMGASAASVVSYAVVWLMRLIDSRKYARLQICLVRDCFCYVLIIAQAIMTVYLPSKMGYVSSITVFVIIVLFNFKDLRVLYRLAESFIKTKRGK